jgi:hypothetical protein
MKFVSLPSGTIINLEQVAYVSAPGIFGDEKPENASLHVHFSAVSYAVGKIGAGGGSLHVLLRGKDIPPFLNALANSQSPAIPIGPTMEAITKKMN